MVRRSANGVVAAAAGLTLVLGVVAAGVLAGGSHTAADPAGTGARDAAQPTVAPAAPIAAVAPVAPIASEPATLQSASAQPVAEILPTLPPLGSLIEADVLVRTTAPLSASLQNRLVLVTRAKRALTLSSATVSVGHGTTLAAAADPAAVRVWTAKATAAATGVWQRVAAGQVALAHAVATADAVPLGSTTTITGPQAALSLLVGAYATSGIPGVGVFVDPAAGSRLGLVPATALLLSVPGRDPAVSAALAAKALGTRGTAVPVSVTAAPAGRWVAPVTGQVTSPFGMRIHPITGQPEFHAGIDIGAPLGAPVYAMSAGDVLYAGAASGFGQEIVLQHSGGVTSVYGHMSQLLVTGGHVRVGQPIALVGNEGESTGPHLHVEVRVDGDPVDPLRWLVRHGVHIS